jgi:hypothetical protein
MALAKVVRSFVYKCPECGETVGCEADIFSLAEGCTHHCECGRSSIRAIKQGGRYRVSTPCGFCGDVHRRNFTMMELVRGNPLFIFCPLNDLYCACIGSAEKIKKEVAELEMSFKEGERIKRKPDEYWNSPTAKRQILKKMVTMIKAGLMGCSCGGRDMELQLLNEETFLRCKSCGNQVAMPTLDGITREQYPEIDEVLYIAPAPERNNITPINRINGEK